MASDWCLDGDCEPQLVIIYQQLPVSIEFSGSATESEYQELLKELNIMAAVGDHPNLVSLIGACTVGGRYSRFESQM